jgi:hypothetical protein
VEVHRDALKVVGSEPLEVGPRTSLVTQRRADAREGAAEADALGIARVELLVQ